MQCFVCLFSLLKKVFKKFKDGCAILCVCVYLKGIQGNRLVISHRMEVICCVACILHLCVSTVCCA